MNAPHLDLTSDFLFPKIHSLWAEALRGDRLNLFLQANSLPNLKRYLAAANIDAEKRDVIEKRLVERLLKALAHIEALLRPAESAFYRACAERWFIENVKTCFRLLHVPNAELDPEYVLLASPLVPDVAPALKRARDVEQFVELMPETDYRPRLTEIAAALSAGGDLLRAESHADDLYYRRLHEVSGRLPRRVRGLALTLCGMEADIQNLVTAFRNASLYRFGPDRIADLFIGVALHIDRETLIFLSQQDVEKMPLDAIPNPYRHALLNLWRRQPMYICENALWRLLFTTAERAFRDYGRPDESVVAFPYLKAAEAVNLGRLFEGLYFGLPVPQIRDMMIATG